MKKYFWLFGGITVVTVAFFIPEQAGEMWNSLLLASIAGVLYLIILMSGHFKKIALRSKSIITAALTCMTALFMLMAVISYEQSQKQESNLAIIRSHIESQMAKAIIHEALLTTLKSFYDFESNSAGKSLSAAFYTKYDSLVSDNGIYRYSPDEERTLHIHVAKATADSIVLIAQSESISGLEKGFDNYDGQKGLIQTVGILTKSGISYERQN